MRRFLKAIGVISLCVLMTWTGLRMAQAITASTTYSRISYQKQHWDITLEAWRQSVVADLSSICTSVTSLGTTVANWVTTVQTPVLIETTPIFVNDHQFTLTGDYTSVLTVGKKILADNGQDPAVGNTILTSTYAAPNTTVTLTYNNLTANLQAVSYYATRSGTLTYGSGDVVASEYGSPSWANLQAAVAVANASGRRLVLTPGVWPVSDDLVITAPIYAVAAAKFQPATTKTLTLSQFDGSFGQHFDCVGTGKVEFGLEQSAWLYPNLWAENASQGTTDMTAALSAFMTAVNGHRGYLTGVYKTTALLTVPAWTNVVLQGREGAKITGSFGYDLIYFSGALENVQINDIWFNTDYVNAVAHWAGVVYTYETNVINVHFNRCKFSSPDANGQMLGIYVNNDDGSPAVAYLDGLWVEDCRFIDGSNLACAVVNLCSDVDKWSKCVNVHFNRNYGEDLGQAGGFGMLLTLNRYSTNVEVCNNYLKNGLINCIEILSTKGGVIDGNMNETTGATNCSVFSIENSEGLSVTNNKEITPALKGCAIDNTSNSVFSGNRLQTSGAILGYGVINLTAGDGKIISGNKFINEIYSGAGSYIVYCATTGTGTITKNVWTNSTADNSAAAANIATVFFSGAGTTYNRFYGKILQGTGGSRWSQAVSAANNGTQDDSYNLSGSWTPTMTAVLNVSAVSANGLWKFTRVGDMVMFSGEAAVTPTAAGPNNTRFGVSLPISSNFTSAANDASGTVTPREYGDYSGGVIADTTNDRLDVRMVVSAGAGVVRPCQVTGIYWVKP